MKKQYKYNKAFATLKENIENTSYGLCPAPMAAQVALNILIDYLLGDDWYVTMPMGIEQVNASAVEQILDRYSRQWQKDWKNYKKEAENK